MSRYEYADCVSDLLERRNGITLDQLARYSTEVEDEVEDARQETRSPEDAASELVRQHMPEVELAAMRGAA